MVISACAWQQLPSCKIFSNLSDAHKKQLDTFFATASVMSTDYMGICRTLVTEALPQLQFSWDNVRLSKRVLLENQMTDAGKIMKVTFEQLLPRPGHDYIFDPTIKKFLGETFLDPLAINKGKRENYRGMSSNNLKLD